MHFYVVTATFCGFFLADFFFPPRQCIHSVCVLVTFALQTKLSSVSLRGISASNSANDLSGSDFHGNYAFEGIGDDDL